MRAISKSAAPKQNHIPELPFPCAPESATHCDLSFCPEFAGHWGLPTFGVSAFVGMLAATIASIVESVGDYSTTARACQVIFTLIGYSCIFK